MSPFFSCSALDLSQKIKTKEVSAQELVDVFIRRIEAVNPAINAVVETRFGLARQEAEQIDKNLDLIDFKSKPFLGVPFTSKEMFAI